MPGIKEMLSKCLSHVGKGPGPWRPPDHLDISLREGKEQHLPPASMCSFPLGPSFQLGDVRLRAVGLALAGSSSRWPCPQPRSPRRPWGRGPPAQHPVGHPWAGDLTLTSRAFAPLSPWETQQGAGRVHWEKASCGSSEVVLTELGVPCGRPSFELLPVALLSGSDLCFAPPPPHTQVDLYGFGADSKGNWHHYWENNPSAGAFRKTGVHDGDFESNVTATLASINKIRIFKGR